VGTKSLYIPPIRPLSEKESGAKFEAENVRNLVASDFATLGHLVYHVPRHSMSHYKTTSMYINLRYSHMYSTEQSISTEKTQFIHFTRRVTKSQQP
jgi:hypothetical protein